MPPAPARASRYSTRAPERPSRSSCARWRRSRRPSSHGSRLISSRPWGFRIQRRLTFTCAKQSSFRRARNPPLARTPAEVGAAPESPPGSSLARASLAALHVRVRERRLAAIHKIQQRLIDRRVERRRFVLRELLLPQLVGPLRHVAAAFGLPLLEAVVVRQRRAIKRGLEVGLRVRAPQEVFARANLADGVHRLPVLAQVHTCQ